MNKPQSNQVPAFPIEAFPPTFQAIVKCLKEQAKFNIDHVSTMILTTASALIGNSCKIQIKNTWKENCILWTSIVADSGSMKSPIINFCTEPLLQIEIDLADKHVDKIKDWEDERDDFIGDKRNKGLQFNKPKPRRPDMILSTATIEGVRDAFARNPRGFILLQDELAGWIKDMTAYSSGSAQEQWLSLQNGKFIKNNTKGTESEFVSNPFVSVSGGIQPSKLYLMAKDGRGSDGSLYRILFSFPDSEPVQKLDDNDIEIETIDLYKSLMTRIFSLGSPENKEALLAEFKEITNNADKHGQYNIKLSTEAKKLFFAWNETMSNQINEDLENSTFRSIIKKMEGYIPRFALILESMYWADTEALNVFSEVTEKSMKGAIQIVEYYTATAFKVQSVLNKSSTENNGASAGRYKIDWNKLYKYVDEAGIEKEHKELKQKLIIDHLMDFYSMSRKTAQRKIEDELTSTKYGFYAK